MAANGWSEYRHHVLTEMDRLGEVDEEQWKLIRDTREDFLLFKGKLIGIALAVGAGAGAIASVIVWLITKG